ncbi:HTH domain-containing protein [Phyllobacterium sp. CCNWLW109]|uniref:HTH domain-containing protein n=1 Tax=Phyllobacterium sp. CCNWLW109 TaxID=3127479 RepID=UPI00307708B7
MSFSKSQDLIRLAQLGATRRTGISLDEICEQFAVSHRTAQRMTDALKTLFTNVEAIDGPDRRLSWRVADSMLDGLQIRRKQWSTPLAICTLVASTWTHGHDFQRANRNSAARVLIQIRNG